MDLKNIENQVLKVRLELSKAEEDYLGSYERWKGAGPSVAREKIRQRLYEQYDRLNLMYYSAVQVLKAAANGASIVTCPVCSCDVEFTSEIQTHTLQEVKCAASGLSLEAATYLESLNKMERLQREIDALTGKIEQLTSQRDALIAQGKALIAQRETLIAQRKALIAH